MVVIASNTLNKSEITGGRPTKGDPQASAPSDLRDRYETAVGRGIYATAEWSKATACSLPFVMDGVRVQAHFVLLLRVPGTLQDVGITVSMGEAKHKSLRQQLDLDGKTLSLKDNWAIISAESYHEELIEELPLSEAEVLAHGFFRCVRMDGLRAQPKSVMKQAQSFQLKVDPELQKRKDRQEMQTEAEVGHKGEPKWTNVDPWGLEVISSHCSVVGFFIGYGPALGAKNSTITSSRQRQAERNVDWMALPPLCRQDDAEKKNRELTELRQRSLSAEEPGDAATEPSDSGEEVNWDS